MMLHRKECDCPCYRSRRLMRPTFSALTSLAADPRSRCPSRYPCHTGKSMLTDHSSKKAAQKALAASRSRSRCYSAKKLGYVVQIYYHRHCLARVRSCAGGSVAPVPRHILAAAGHAFATGVDAVLAALERTALAADNSQAPGRVHTGRETWRAKPFRTTAHSGA
jgi:hypothetical protein